MIRQKNLTGLAVISFIFVFLIYPVSAEEFTIDRDVLNKILERLDSQGKKIEALQDQLKRKGGGIKAPLDAKESSKVEYLEEDVSEISERLDKLETKSILNKITFGGEMRFRNDFLQMKDEKTSKTTRSDDNWSTRFRLNLKGDITDNIIFHGRLTSFKMWGDSTSEEMVGDMRMDMNYGRVPNDDGNLHVERAYIDYFLEDFPLCFTIGRQPTTDGPPAELQDNSTRKSTYPALVVNAEMDALMATLTLDKWTGLKNSSFRIGYSKAFQDIASVFTEFDLDDTRAIPLIFETQIPGFDNSLFMFAYARVMDLPSIRQFPDFMVRKQVKSVGDLDLLSGHIQLNNVRNSGIDCFFSWAHSHADTSSRGTRLVSGQEIGLFGDNLGGGLGKDRWGYAVYTGFRYTLPWDSLKNPKIGFEYNYGSKYWLGLFTGGSDDPMHKLMVNGNAIDFYYIQPLHIKHTFMRFGYTRANYDYSPDFGPYGARESVDRIMRSFYCLLDIRF